MTYGPYVKSKTDYFFLLSIADDLASRCKVYCSLKVTINHCNGLDPPALRLTSRRKRQAISRNQSKDAHLGLTQTRTTPTELDLVAHTKE